MCHSNRLFCYCGNVEDTTVRCAQTSQFGSIVPQRCLRNFKIVKAGGICFRCMGRLRQVSGGDPSILSLNAVAQILLAAVDEVATDSSDSN
jgi:hypothetical protein